MKLSFQSRKLRLLVAIAIAVLAAVALILLFPSEKAYRSIVIDEISGEATVSDQKQERSAYAGMTLFDGDTLTVSEGSYVTITLDGDKHMLAEAGTVLTLEASGKAGSDRTVIHLTEGSVLTRIENKLTDDQSYVVNTPTSTISVRGTVFYLLVEPGEASVTHHVLDGTLAITPLDGGEGSTELLEAGHSAEITLDADGADFVRNEDGEFRREIPYDTLSAQVIRTLLAYVDDGETLAVDRDFLQELLPDAPEAPAGTAAPEESADPSEPAGSACAETDDPTAPDETTANGSVIPDADTDTPAPGETDGEEEPAETEHTHILSEEYAHDATHHWRYCTVEGCHEIGSKTEHILYHRTLVEATHSHPGQQQVYCAASCGREFAPEEREFSGYILDFSACGMPSFGYDHENVLPNGSAFDPAKVKLVGIYSDTKLVYDQNEHLVSYDYGRVLDAEEYDCTIRRIVDGFPAETVESFDPTSPGKYEIALIPHANPSAACYYAVTVAAAPSHER